MVRGSHGGVKTICAVAAFTPGSVATVRCTEAFSCGPYGQKGEVNVIVTLTSSPPSGCGLTSTP